MRVFFVLILAIFSFSLADVVFKPTKNVFKEGEKICFSLKNDTNKIIYLPSSAPWVVFDKEGKVLYSPVAIQKIVKLKPKSEKKWCWNQKNFKNENVLSGEYKVRLTVFEDGKRKFLSFNVKVQPYYKNGK